MIFRASRPLIAAQVLRATTAIPPSGWNSEGGGAAGDHIGAVHQFHVALADVAELRGRLQDQRLARRHGQAGCRDSELPVAELALRRRVHDLVVKRSHFGDGDPPARGRGLLQHGPRGGAAAAHRFEEVAHAARAVGVLVAESGLIPRRLPDLHVVPVGFQLVGNHHRQAGAHALAHFLAVAGDRDRAVFCDRDEDERTVHPAVRHRIGAVFLFVGGEGEPRPAHG